MSAKWWSIGRATWIRATWIPPLILVKDWIWLHPVDGSSMAPTLNSRCPWFPGGLMSDWALVLKQPEFYAKGDIVMLHNPGLGDRIFRRIVATAGDVVEGSEGAVTIQEGRCWLQCDDPEAAPSVGKCPLDSRYFSAIPLGLLEGLVVGVVWPPWRWRRMDLGDDDDDGDGGGADDE
eukprot:NODE_21103_length_768_cov_8.535101.p1 GENE.NODE_21103_length_768_cov_8.535101~~NODE_21103_length_768_cov_8.535101.p1  ORF type:complete len:177 (+),score=27.62 NODE_21103_length_768_cov_8.535101:90-620(+)